MATIIDVAKKAGVSFKTVSRVLNNESSVRPATRAKVLSAARALNYQVNQSARQLRAQTFQTAALIIANPSQSYSEDTQIGALIASQAAGFRLRVFDTFDLSSLPTLLEVRGLSGIVLSPPWSNSAQLLAALAEAEIAVVRIGPEGDAGACDQIGIDDRAAARDMTAHLIGLGHRRIGFIRGAQTFDVARRRLAGYRDALEAAGLGFETKLITEGDFTYESGLRCGEALLALPDRPTAIFASNDEMAAACLASAYKLGLRVPTELSVAGFDDAPVSRIIYPSLTTVQQDMRAMVGRAFEILSARLRDRDAPYLAERFDHATLARASTAAPPLSTTRSKL